MANIDNHVTTICPFCQSNSLVINNGDGFWWAECCACHGRGPRASSREEAQYGWNQVSGNMQLLQMMINQAPSAFVVKDTDGRFVFANSRFADFFGVSIDDMIGKREHDFIKDEKLAEFYHETLSRPLISGQAEVLDEQVIDPFSYKPRWFRSNKVPITLGADKKPMVFMVTHEITELKNAHQELQAKERRFLQAMMASGEAMWESDNETLNIVFGNEEIVNILGLSTPQTVFSREEFESLVHPDDRASFNREVFEILPQQGRTSFQHRLLRKDGGEAWVRNRIQVTERDEQGEPYRFIGSMRDVTKRKLAELELQMTRHELEQTNSRLESLVEQRTSELVELNLELQSLARKDSLTGLANRMAADEYIASEFARLKRGHNPYVVMLADIDHFKSVNDTWGHALGDKALMHVARLLRQNLRSSDLVARYGGEEFLIIIHTDDLEAAHQLAEGIRRLVELTPLNDDVSMTLSMGISAACGKDGSHSDAIARADAKLYEAKSAGRNRVCSAFPVND